jgi:hypothetical protein
MDILLHRNSPEKQPLAVIEVGRNTADWWKKFDQGFQYVQMVGQSQQEKQPILFAVLAIDTTSENDAFRSILGVFLCVPSPADTTML